MKKGMPNKEDQGTVANSLVMVIIICIMCGHIALFYDEYFIFEAKIQMVQLLYDQFVYFINVGWI